MSATADFMLEIGEAFDYVRARLRDFEVKRAEDRIVVKGWRGTYEIRPIPRGDYKTSRRMREWSVKSSRPGLGVSGGRIAGARSYEDAVVAVEKDMGIHKDEDDGLPR